MMDSNHRAFYGSDLQSDAIGLSANPPENQLLLLHLEAVLAGHG